MGLFTSINIAATGMSAERLRTDVISNNITLKFNYFHYHPVLTVIIINNGEVQYEKTDNNYTGDAFVIGGSCGMHRKYGR